MSLPQTLLQHLTSSILFSDTAYAPIAVNGFSYTTTDYTLLVDSVLSFGPSVLLLLCAPVRLRQLREERLKLVPNRVGAVKAVCIRFIILLSTTLVALAKHMTPQCFFLYICAFG